MADIPVVYTLTVCPACDHLRSSWAKQGIKYEEKRVDQSQDDLDEALLAAAQAPEAVAMEPRPWRKYDARLDRNRRLYGRLFDSGDLRQDKVVRWSQFADWLSGAEESPPPVALLPGEGLPPAEVADEPVVVMQPFSAKRRPILP